MNDAFQRGVAKQHPLFRPWIGVDLDGTLAVHNPSDGCDHTKVGPPIPRMLSRVKQWVRDGKEVRIFTARAVDPASIPPIHAWCAKYGLPPLQVTNIKDPGMVELWDDRAVTVRRNTGVRR